MSDRIAALEQRVLELETECAALGAFALWSLFKDDPTSREDLFRQAIGGALNRWPELDAGEILRAVDEIMAASVRKPRVPPASW